MIKAFFRSVVSRISPEAPVPVVKTDGPKPYRVVIDQDEIDDQAAAILAEWGKELPKNVRIVPGTPTTLTQLFTARGWAVMHVESQFPINSSPTPCPAADSGSCRTPTSP